MMIVDQNGNLEGELNLSSGVLDGREIFYDSNGLIAEEYLWRKGKRVQ